MGTFWDTDLSLGGRQVQLSLLGDVGCSLLPALARGGFSHEPDQQARLPLLELQDFQLEAERGCRGLIYSH